MQQHLPIIFKLLLLTKKPYVLLLNATVLSLCRVPTKKSQFDVVVSLSRFNFSIPWILLLLVVACRYWCAIHAPTTFVYSPRVPMLKCFLVFSHSLHLPTVNRPKPVVLCATKLNKIYVFFPLKVCAHFVFVLGPCPTLSLKTFLLSFIRLHHYSVLSETNFCQSFMIKQNVIFNWLVALPLKIAFNKKYPKLSIICAKQVAKCGLLLVTNKKLPSISATHAPFLRPTCMSFVSMQTHLMNALVSLKRHWPVVPTFHVKVHHLHLSLMEKHSPMCLTNSMQNFLIYR
mmetsp:Transcript_5584/g.8563  ORF Transcript_5584/g.8563 Transcript_5584/m.8563 type:complete len:287 (-) Transcript_5584:1406-2266(-)